MLKSVVKALYRAAAVAFAHRFWVSLGAAVIGGRDAQNWWVVKTLIGWGFGLVLQDLWRRATGDDD